MRNSALLVRLLNPQNEKYHIPPKCDSARPVLLQSLFTDLVNWPDFTNSDSCSLNDYDNHKRNYGIQPFSRCHGIAGGMDGPIRHEIRNIISVRNNEKDI